MHVSKLRLSNIRCFERAEFLFGREISLLVGENNAGKTTAVYALMALQRPRLGPESVRYGASEGFVQLDIAEADSEVFPVTIRGNLVQATGDTITYQASWRVDPQGASAPTLTLSSRQSISFSQFPDGRPDNYLVMYL